MSDIPLCKRLTLPPLKLANSLYPFRVPSPKTCVTLRKECTVMKYNSCQTVWVVQLMDKLPQRVSFPSTTASLVIVMYHLSTKVQPQKGIRNWVFTTWGTEGSWLHTRAVLSLPESISIAVLLTPQAAIEKSLCFLSSTSLGTGHICFSNC